METISKHHITHTKVPCESKLHIKNQWKEPMNADDMPIFTSILQRLGLRYEKPINMAMIDEYWQALEQFDLLALKEAIHAHACDTSDGRYWPYITDLKKQMANIQKKEGRQMNI
jgi:hypothetical protein